MEEYPQISANLKELRKKLGLSQADFSAQINIPFRTYQRYESGERTPKMAMLQGIASVCNVPVEWILTGEYPPSTADRAAEQLAEYHDDLTKKILTMLEDMTKDQKRQALRFIEGQKLLAESEKKLKEG